MRWDKPEVYGAAMKRVDCREYKSAFNSKRKIRDAFVRLVQTLDARYLLVSFSNEGYLGFDELNTLLSARGEVASATVAHKRYVGAQIGIYNPRGEKVGRVSHLKNSEYLFLVGPDAGRLMSTAADEADATALGLA